MLTTPGPFDIAIEKTTDLDTSYAIAARLPDYFTASGLQSLRGDLARGELYGAFVGDRLVGFALYRELNREAVELAWLAVDRPYRSRGVGTRLVNASLDRLASHYRACEVKTLAAAVSDAGYARTRQFYAKLGFIPLEVIDPYPGWNQGTRARFWCGFSAGPD